MHTQNITYHLHLYRIIVIRDKLTSLLKYRAKRTRALIYYILYFCVNLCKVIR